MRSSIAYVGLVFLLAACSSTLTDPQLIIDKAIQASGGDRYLNATIDLDFRDRHYQAKRSGGNFSYQRSWTDSTGTIVDQVSNEGFSRSINGATTSVPDSMISRYYASTNSVLYFALLPYGLNDPAVRKEFIGETELEGAPYYIVKITFDKQGGGEDFEDTFYYWINKKTFLIGYLAYIFNEKSGTDMRFRKAINTRTVGGVVFHDYINYKPSAPSSAIGKAEEMYKAGQLVELSRIELANIHVAGE
jgi:hypothetical protein